MRAFFYANLSEPRFSGFKDFQDLREDESTPNAREAFVGGWKPLPQVSEMPSISQRDWRG